MLLLALFFFIGPPPASHFSRAHACVCDFLQTAWLQNVATDYGDFCGDRFFYTSSTGQELFDIDLETGASKRLALNFPNREFFRVRSFGRRMWLYGMRDW